MRCVCVLPLLLAALIRAQNITGDQAGNAEEGVPDQTGNAEEGVPDQAADTSAGNQPY